MAEQLGVPYYALMNLFRLGKLVPPRKDASGDFVWSADDVLRAREALKGLRQRRKASV